jgi:four helix bundle protein
LASGILEKVKKMQLEYARSFQDLLVYRRAFQVAKKIFEFSKAFPEEEKYALSSQIRRSSRSVGAQITEAWAKRKYERHFTSKLTDADGEQLETQLNLLLCISPLMQTIP